MKTVAKAYNPPPNWPAPPAGWTPPPGWQPDSAWGPPPTGWQLWVDRRPWVARHKVLTGLAALVVLLIVAVAAGGSPKKKPAASTPSAQSATATASAVSTTPKPSVDKAKVKTQAAVAKMASDANRVVVNVEAVQIGIGLLAKNATITDQVSFAQLVQQAHTQIDAVRDNFALPSVPSSLSNRQSELVDAANTLKNCMGTILTYMQDTTNPVTLATMETQYSTGISEWNAAVTAIWTAAGEAPPTIPAG